MRVLARIVAVAGFLVLMLPTTAQGHAAYKDSDPPDESTVSSAPSELWAEFTEPPAQGSTLSVFNECGERVDLGNSRVDAFRLYIGVDSPHKGGFRVDFRVTSAYDSHVTTGSFTFTATGGEDCAGPPPEAGTGSNSGDGNDPSGSDDDGSAEASGTDDDEGEGTSVAGEPFGGDDSRGSENGSGAGRNGGRERDGGGENQDEDSARPVAAGDPSPDAPGPWEGIELRDLLVGYAFAILIGAAGGKVYAGIVGPRR